MSNIIHCQLIIYSVPFEKSKNACFAINTSPLVVIERLRNFTNIIFAQFQLPKLDVKMSVIVPTFYNKLTSFNYASLAVNSKLSDEASTTTTCKFYYIVGRHVVSTNSTRLDLELDVLNTYAWWPSALTNRTYVIREHRNRFKPLAVSPGSTNSFSNIVDYVDEGFKPTLYKATTHTFTPSAFAGKNFYLMYRAKSNILAGSTQPIGCYLLSDDLILASIGASRSPTPILSAGLARDCYQWFFKKDNPSIFIYHSVATGGSPVDTNIFNSWSDDDLAIVLHTYNGSTGLVVQLIRYRQNESTGRLTNETIYTNEDVRTSASDFNMTVLGSLTGYRQTDNLAVLTDGDTISQDEVDEVAFTYLGLGLGNAQYALNIGGVDRSDSRIMKIIKLPYPPVNFTESIHGEYSFDGFLYDSTVGMYALVNLSKEFSLVLNPLEVTEGFVTTITQPLTSNLYTTPRSVLDPKIYNSSYYYYKLGYDSFSVVIPLERVNVDNDISYENINVTFKPSNTITTRFAFFFEFDNSGLALTDDFGQYLIVSRNNEMPIYSSSYLDYLRQGYNYDVKNKNLSDISRWVGFGLTGVSSGLQATAGGAFGKAGALTSLSSGLANSIIGQIQSDTKMEEALHNKSLQSASVSGADDSDLLSYYGGNELRLYTYKCKDDIAQSLNNFFYYYGYATNRYEKPDITTRLNFNYLECVAQFDEKFTVNPSIISLITGKLKEGVTIYHYSAYLTYGYDFSQEYENFESFFKE